MGTRKALTVEEMRDIIEDPNFWVSDDRATIDIVVLPPEVDYITDEDEADEDVVGVAEVRDVPGVLEVEEEEKIEVIPISKKSCKKQRLSTSVALWRKCPPKYNFPEAEFSNIEQVKIQKLRQDLGSLTPLQLFEKFITEELLEHIRGETIRYAKCVKNNPDFSIDVEELKVFLGILLFSGYHHVPSERMFWSRDEDLGIAIVQKAMSRNRYIKIKSMLHFANNDVLNKDDKLFKIRPIIEKLNDSFQQFGTFTSHLSIDEMMVKYFGHHGLKQFIKGKPIRFGYKLWALCASNGYCYKFIPYTGKETNDQVGLTLGSRVVTELLNCVSIPNEHCIFFDNFFTNRDLLVHLSYKGFRATGTVRENRTDKCPMQSSKELNKTIRGSYDYRFDINSSILMVRWHDNKCVIVASNYDKIEPLAKVSRWSRESKQRIDIQQPKLIKSYNKFMGGVDHLDWLVGKYAIQIRGKKWYWPLFTRLLDISLTNAWILYRILHGNDACSCLEFRRSISVAYLKISCKTSNNKFSASASHPVLDVRFDNIGHFIQCRTSQRRCQRKGCKSKPTTFCVKCDVTLCAACFLPYHKN